MWPRFARLVVRAVLVTLFRIRLVGRPPERGPYVLVANHQGWADAFLILALFPPEPRIHFIGDRRATMSVWWKRLVLRSLGVVVPVARDSSSERPAIESALRLLADGAVVAIFPEGQIPHVEGDVCPACLRRGRVVERAAPEDDHRRAVAPFQRGVGYLALKSHAPVLPVWLSGTAELYLGRELAAVVGELVPPREARPTKDATEALATELRAALLRIAAPLSDPLGVTKRWRWLTHLL